MVQELWNAEGECGQSTRGDHAGEGGVFSSKLPVEGREERKQKAEARNSNVRTRGEEVGVRGRSQVDKNKETSERQPHPFCLNRRKG